MTSNGPADEAVHGDDQNNVEVASDDLSGNTGDEGEDEDDRIGDSEQSDSLNGSPSPSPSSALPRTSNPSRPLDTNTTNTTPRQSNTQPSTDPTSPRTRPQTQTQTRAPYPTQLQTPPPTPQQPQTQSQTQRQTQSQSQTQTQTQVQNRPQTRVRSSRRPRPQSMSYISDSSNSSDASSFFSPSHHLSIAPLDTSHTRTRRLRANAPPNNGPSLTSLKPIKTRPNQAPLLDLQPLSALAPMLNPLPLPPGTAPPRAKLAVQLKMNLEIEVTLKARVCGDVLLTLL